MILRGVGKGHNGKTLNAKPIKRFEGIVALPMIAHFRIILPNIG
jgi:hypothetical protein